MNRRQQAQYSREWQEYVEAFAVVRGKMNEAENYWVTADAAGNECDRACAEVEYHEIAEKEELPLVLACVKRFGTESMGHIRNQASELAKIQGHGFNA